MSSGFFALSSAVSMIRSLWGAIRRGTGARMQQYPSSFVLDGYQVSRKAFAQSDGIRLSLAFLQSSATLARQGFHFIQ